jgi:hypothetical protein
MLRNILLTLFAGLFLLSGCNVINPKETTPTYIHIDSFKFNAANYETQGASTHDIRTIFVYYSDNVNNVNNPVGTFDLPATFPVIANGTGTLQIMPGIAEDGLQDFQGAYPFYTTDTFSFAANPGKIINHTPVTGYNTSGKFLFLDNFDVANNFTYLSGTDSMVITHDQDKVLQGGGSGYIYLTRDSASCEEIQVPNAFPISSVTYLEFDYKCDIPFTVGFVGFSNAANSVPYYIGGLKASSGVWQHAYFNYSQIPNSFPFDTYRVTLKTVLPTGQATGYVLIDNVKVISAN